MKNHSRMEFYIYPHSTLNTSEVVLSELNYLINLQIVNIVHRQTHKSQLIHTFDQLINSIIEFRNPALCWKRISSPNIRDILSFVCESLTIV